MHDFSHPGDVRTSGVEGGVGVGVDEPQLHETLNLLSVALVPGEGLIMSPSFTRP